ncbi:MAG: hypothetical protein WCD12_01600 [Candidatus Binatus sp.]|uniref:hypothetical protein n=1 Tax=Candidatus Binatus sp. TaxID=2811406 RepID=UPI003C74D219
MGDRAKVGESGGAYILTNAIGEEFVLKFGRGAETRPERAAQITKRLREAGFPAPAYVCVGNDGSLKYSIQSMLPGEPNQRLNAAAVRQLIAINRLQAGLADDLPPEWPSRVIDGVLKGFEGYCVIDTLRRHSGESAAMLQTLQELIVRYSAEIIPHARHRSLGFESWQRSVRGKSHRGCCRLGRRMRRRSRLRLGDLSLLHVRRSRNT